MLEVGSEFLKQKVTIISENAVGDKLGKPVNRYEGEIVEISNGFVVLSTGDILPISRIVRMKTIDELDVRGGEDGKY